MTHDNNALAQELEAYLAANPIGMANARLLRKCVTALRQPAPASGGVGEPVAWMYCDHDPVEPWIHVQLERASKNTHPYCEETPLYTADMIERLAGSGEQKKATYPDDGGLGEQVRPLGASFDGFKMIREHLGVTQPTQQPNICEHGIRHPWACHECDDATWAKHTAAQPTQQPGGQVERVANAISNADLDGPDPEDYWDYLAGAAIAAMPSGEVGQVDVAPIWRNAITNTIALIDITRRKHKPKSKGHAAFDAELNDLLDKWYSFSRGVSPETYVQAESEWQRFKSIAMPLPTPPAQGEAAILKAGDAR